MTPFPIQYVALTLLQARQLHRPRRTQLVNKHVHFPSAKAAYSPPNRLRSWSVKYIRIAIRALDVRRACGLAFAALLSHIVWMEKKHKLPIRFLHRLALERHKVR